jgi:K+-sensing histidine kinase KdpD
VRIAFSDTGPGIPDTNSADIFEPFISSSSKGLGLGLSISQRICRAHGGLISATNNADGGARFTVILPIPRPVPRGKTVEAPEGNGKGRSPRRREEAAVEPAKEGSAT